MNRRFLGWAAAGFTYALMVWGNMVSSTGSGLACPDWPLCHGTLTPPISFAVVLEWGHRLLASITTFFIVLTIYKVFTAQPSTPILRRSGKSLLALLALQIGLGGTTVLLGLSVPVSTIHLLVATMVFSGMICVASVMTWDNPVVSQPSRRVRGIAALGLAGMLVQFTMGALVRHTHSGLACPYFPACLEGFFPIPFTFGSLLAFIHRWWGVALVGVFFSLWRATRHESPALSRVAGAVFGLGLAQVGLGIATVLSGLQTHARATHAALGYGLWGLLFYIALRSGFARWLWEAKPKPESKTVPAFAPAEGART